MENTSALVHYARMSLNIIQWLRPRMLRAAVSVPVHVLLRRLNNINYKQALDDLHVNQGKGGSGRLDSHYPPFDFFGHVARTTCNHMQ